MKMYWTATLAILALAICTAGKYGLKDATVRFRVVDDQGQPVTNAHVVAYSLSNDKGEGRTDGRGEFAYFARNIYPPLGGTFRKEDHYRSQGDLWTGPFGVAPTDMLTVVLKRILNPVPMVQRTVETHLPRLDEPVGFDLAEGDWVAPDGAGKVADVLMTGTMRYVSRKDHEIRVLVAFPNAADGVREFRAIKPDDLRLASDLMPPQQAPTEGYGRELELWQSCEPNGWLREHDESDRSYLFRIRTKVDEEGRVVEAKHGWTYGEIAVDSEDGKRIWMRIRYYFNPDPRSRSLEPKEIADRQGKYLPDAKP